MYPSIENIKKRIGELKVQNILTNKWKKSHGKRWQLLNKINASYHLFFFFFLLSFSLLKHRTITYAETCSVLQCILVAFIWSDRRSFVHTWKIYTGIYTQCNAFFISLILFQCSYSWFWQALMSIDIREQTNKSNKEEENTTKPTKYTRTFQCSEARF